MDEVLEQVGLGDFVRRCSSGIDTLVGERGMNLSGGQRQSIAFSRALLKDAPILLFGEWNAALDQTTRSNLLMFLNTLDGRTVLSVTHVIRGIDSNWEVLSFGEGSFHFIGKIDKLHLGNDAQSEGV
ncbi:MAG: hypothetical protein ACYCYO_11915 [Bacilli bacterium]